jgi:uncharacterized protein (DUF1778 family)
MPEPHIAIRLDEEDRALLEACAKAEKLTKSDIIRRAVREYARKLGVAPAPKRGKARKPA